MRTTTRAGLLGLTAAGALISAGCQLLPGGSDAGPEPTRTSATPTTSAVPTTGTEFSAARITALLEQARVVDRRPQVPGYERDCGPGEGCVFGTAWSDDTDAPQGHNGCDTRNDVLAATLDDVRFAEGSNDCDVVAGHFTDPFTGRVMDYATEGSQIHVDHLFPLAAAWDLGAAEWTPEQRARFANDTELELLAVNGGANSAKGDSTPASWLPPHKPYRCEYVTRYLEVAAAYDLALTAADVTVIGYAARRC